ncbi:glycosyltransferase [Rossellomorea sp. DA94]|uniref:glycosyltransferase n=1 Tax=Rossellomorea sp. DA94 TaxID=3038653 RepID=UPI0024477D61|nr:glycosyltransferase [Rossellomorea sp. DA94]WGG45414.1 glycosyltransferase [Rossellomorea sp. DA94]
MNNCLILLTNYYPFHKGEEYLESEIRHLSKKFKDIYIVSTMVSENMKQTRKVPRNVTLIPIGIRHSISGKIGMFSRQYSAIRKNPEKKQMIKDSTNGKKLASLYSYYFESRAMDIYNRLQSKLNEYDFKQYGSITIYSYWLYITARVAVELKKKYFKELNPYTVSRAHGYDINEHVNLLKFLPEREFLLGALDKVFPVSQNGVNFLKRKYSDYESKVEVRRLGTRKLNVKQFKNNNQLHIVSCSTVRKLKRIDLIIESLMILREKQIDFKWTHIGGGPEFENIKKLASKKLESHQFEFTGYVKNNEVLDWYQNNQATVFINTSSSEGVPVSIMEAMSMGLPVIATDVGGTKEIVVPNVTGILLKSDCTIEDIANGLITFNSMKQENYNQMRQAAYSLWDKDCNADKLYSSFAAELSSVDGTSVT